MSMKRILDIPLLSNRFKEYIKTKGYKSIADFARDCGLHPQSIFRHIRGEHTPDVKRLFLYADTLKVPITELLTVFYPDSMSLNAECCLTNSVEV
jgi:transcriptional regulator with XRE-family HTH domain